MKKFVFRNKVIESNFRLTFTKYLRLNSTPELFKTEQRVLFLLPVISAGLRHVEPEVGEGV